jgi:hypothetical protein
MALHKVQPIDLQYLNIWFSNIVDTLNYNIQQIETAVPTLAHLLTTLDTPPDEYLKDSFKKLVENINQSFNDIDDRLRSIESKITTLGATNIKSVQNIQSTK